MIYLNRKKPLLSLHAVFHITSVAGASCDSATRYVVVADRYLYIPYIAFAIGLSMLSYHLYERQRKWILYAGFLYCSYLCVYTASYAPAWKNSDTLKEHLKKCFKEKRKLTLVLILNTRNNEKEQNRSISLEWLY